MEQPRTPRPAGPHRAVAWPLAFGIAVLVSSCSGTAAPKAATTTPVGPTVTTPVTAAATPTTPPATTTAPPAPATCQPAQLAATVYHVGGAGGSGAADVILTDRSRQSCTVYGYPGLGFETANRQRV